MAAARGKFTSKLSNLNNIWKKTRKEVGNDTSGYRDVPSGNYEASIHLELKEWDNGELYINSKFTIHGGEFDKSCVFSSQNLEGHDRSLEFVMKFFNGMGYTDFDISDLEDVIKDVNSMHNVIYAITVKRTPSKNDPDKEYCNVYVSGIVSGAEPDQVDNNVEASEETSDNSKDYTDDIGIKLDEADTNEMKNFCDEKELWPKLGFTKRKVTNWVKSLGEDDAAEKFSSEISKALSKKNEDDIEDKNDSIKVVPVKLPDINLDEAEMDEMHSYCIDNNLLDELSSIVGKKVTSRSLSDLTNDEDQFAEWLGSVIDSFTAVGEDKKELSFDNIEKAIEYIKDNKLVDKVGLTIRKLKKMALNEVTKLINSVDSDSVDNEDESGYTKEDLENAKSVFIAYKLPVKESDDTVKLVRKRLPNNFAMAKSDLDKSEIEALTSCGFSDLIK